MKTKTKAVMNTTEAIFMEAPSELFHDVEQSGWIPFLPKPGNYQHAKFGDVVIDSDRNQRMVSSVQNKVYQDKVPLDLEHDLKASGAVGWISDARMNEDGSGDAYVEWTDRGQEVLKGNRFRYISPEWFRLWKDPATGAEHPDVVAGGALTTRPFFKDKVLRALVASERGVEVVGRETFAGGNGAAEAEAEEEEEEEELEEEDTVEAEAEDEFDDEGEDEEGEEEEEAEEVEAEEHSEMPEAFTDDQANAIEAYVEQEINRATQSFAEQLKTEKTHRQRAEQALQVLTVERQTERFTEVVRNRDAGAPWIGGVDKQVKNLTRLAEAFGEDSDEFRDYVEAQQAAAAAVKESQAFSEIGSSASALSEPVKQLEAMAETLRKTKPDLTKEQAFTEVISTKDGARLYAESLSR